jgi:DNA-binding Lrp family transcriptional regulator
VNAIQVELLDLLKTGYCGPQLTQLARKLHAPITTVQYNVKQLEQQGTIRSYKAVLDHRQLDAAYCAIILVRLSPGEYANPDRFTKELSSAPEIESIDICTGGYELVVKARVPSADHYYAFLKKLTGHRGVIRVVTLTSFRQVKSDYVVEHERGDIPAREHRSSKASNDSRDGRQEE